eukprot:TRINITY_DN16274_c0_g1_i2.p1 TRINITY_DN16274_c0_g1~~TRINITY_DN16274_c0_g1_i2.p1  ORF type:complete len:360 (-),score=18.04 TRINITY_DN16274_c0_g1_i2:232-1311(-)
MTMSLSIEQQRVVISGDWQYVGCSLQVESDPLKINTLYCVISDPPLLEGADQQILTFPLSSVVVGALGAEGEVAGTRMLETSEYSPVPYLFVPAYLNLQVEPEEMLEVIVVVKAVPLQIDTLGSDPLPASHSNVQPVIVEPPFSEDPKAIHSTTSPCTLRYQRRVHGLVVEWIALGSSENGGSTITGYTLLWDAGSGSDPSVSIYSGTALTTTITSSISSGSTYKFKYAGTNKYGTGEYSEVSSIRVPATSPSAPSAPTTTLDSGNVKICWSAPSSNGGSEITQYKVFILSGSDSTYKEHPTYCQSPDITTRCCSIDKLIVMQYFSLSTGSVVKAKVSAINADNLESALSAATTSGCTL